MNLNIFMTQFAPLEYVSARIAEEISNSMLIETVTSNDDSPVAFDDTSMSKYRVGKLSTFLLGSSFDNIIESYSSDILQNKSTATCEKLCVPNEETAVFDGAIEDKMLLLFKNKLRSRYVDEVVPKLSHNLLYNDGNLTAMYHEDTERNEYNSSSLVIGDHKRGLYLRRNKSRYQASRTPHQFSTTIRPMLIPYCHTSVLALLGRHQSTRFAPIYPLARVFASKLQLAVETNFLIYLIFVLFK